MLDFVWSVLGFIVAISILVCFHEFGHYWMARRMGVRVLRFSLGWGKPWKSFRTRDGVEWTLAPYPIGGYVKMLDEREGPVPEHERSMAFNNKSVPARMAILAAGPVANFLLAAVFFWMVLVIGIRDWKPVIGTPPAESAAAAAGLREGDSVVAVGSEAVGTLSELQTELLDQAIGAQSLTLQVTREGSSTASPVTLDVSKVRVDPEFLFRDLGVLPYQPPLEPVLDQIMPGQAAENAGFRPGDRILSRDGVAVDSWQSWALWLAGNPGALARIEIQRDGQPMTLDLIVGRAENDPQRGFFGASVEVSEQLWQHLRAERRLGPLEAVPAAVERTSDTAVLILRMLGRMVTGDVSLKNVGGPIQIAQVAGETAQSGLVWFLGFLAGLSVSLGVLNLLPVPMLDGGHLLTYAIEWVKGRPLSERALIASQYVGLAFIGMLMVLAFYNDVMRLI